MKKSKRIVGLGMMLVAGSLLTACGTTPKQTQHSGGVSTEMAVSEDAMAEVQDTEKKKISYVELEACFQVMQTTDVDTSLADGELLDWTTWGRLGTTISIEKSVDIYNAQKGKVGYTKENINAIYIAANEEWSQLAIGESRYSVYVRRDELSEAMGATEPVYDEKTAVCMISNGIYGAGYYDGKNIDMNCLEPSCGNDILGAEISIYSQGKQVLGYIKAGAFTDIITQSEEWAYVSVADGNYIVRVDELKDASIISHYEESERLFAQSGVNIRKGPGTEYEKLGNLVTNDAILVSGEVDNGWYQVHYEGGIGYISGNYLAETEVVIASADDGQEWWTIEELIAYNLSMLTEASNPTPPSQAVEVGSYPAGNYSPGSVYGPKLAQWELDQVAVAVNNFLASYDIGSMDDYTKVKTAHDYLCAVVSYAPSWAENRANTAWGALVYGEAQCSGYARAMKALCDAMGVGCYYVHADEYASNPSHQWNEVCVGGNWYIIDVQCNDSSGWNAVFLLSDDTYSVMTGMSWDRSSVPSCPYDY